jgi:hypothetical protein
MLTRDTGSPKQLAVGLGAGLAQQGVAGFLALGLLGVTVGDCQCLTRTTATAPCVCCDSTRGPWSGTALRAST